MEGITEEYWRKGREMVWTASADILIFLPLDRAKGREKGRGERTS